MPSGFFARHPRKIAAFAILALLVLGGLLCWQQSGMTLADAFAKLKETAEWAAKKSPAYYVGAVALLPYAGVPVSVVYLAGSVYGGAMGVLWTALGLMLNLPLGYLVGKYWLRAPIARFLERKGHRLLDVPPKEFGKLIVLMRIIPGPPLIIQNFLLAMAGVPFWQYFLISLPLTILFAAGFLVTGGALLKGNTGLVITGICLVVALALLAHVVKTIYQNKGKK